MDRLTITLLRIGQAVRTIGLAEAREVGLTPVQAQTLLFVKRTKSFATSVGNLAAHLGATHASTVGVVDALVARGLLERQSAARDRRVTLLRLTPDGEETCTRLERWGHLLEETLTGLTEEERVALERGIGGLVWSLRAAGQLDMAEPCRGCIHFDENAAPGGTDPHHCGLINAFISEEESLKDCPDHTSPEISRRLEASLRLREARRASRLHHYRSTGQFVARDDPPNSGPPHVDVPVVPPALTEPRA